MARAIAVSPRIGYRLVVTYDDGTYSEVCLANDLTGPVFAQVTSTEQFERVQIDELGATEWANGASLSPEFVASLKRSAPVGTDPR
jgi:hypothetical protein